MSELFQLYHGDALRILQNLQTASIDSLVTDCPSGIAFMSKSWDTNKGGRDNWIAWLTEILVECRRVMKPGAYGWLWALPRTQHWTATACEDAGFSVRDVLDEAFPLEELFDTFFESLSEYQQQLFARLIEGIEPSRLSHVFGSGFPKSKALLKPAIENWILIKAPGELRDLRIDDCRIPGIAETTRFDPSKHNHVGWRMTATGLDTAKTAATVSGRWPSNFALIHSEHCEIIGTRKVKTSDPRRADGSVNPGFGGNGIYGGIPDPTIKIDKPRYCDEDGTETVDSWRCVDGCPIKTLDEQSGISVSKTNSRGERHGSVYGGGNGPSGPNTLRGHNDIGGSSRFFYTAKSSTSERNEGLENFYWLRGIDKQCDREQYEAAEFFETLAYILSGFEKRSELRSHGNSHPTVKSIELMKHLIRLVTPPKGTVLDCFMGSGSTGVACAVEDMKFIGIEKEPEYLAISQARIEHAYRQPRQQELFG